MTKSPDISVVIPAHHEGRLANHTLASVFRSAEYAASKGLLTEILVVMDGRTRKPVLFSRKEPFRLFAGKKWILAISA